MELRENVFKELFYDLPKNERRGFVLKCDAPPTFSFPCRVLEVGTTEIGVIFVLMPSSMKSRIWIAIVYAKPVMRTLAIPRNDEFRRLRPSRWVKTSRFKRRFQLFRLNVVRKVFDSRYVRDAVKNVTLELFVQVSVRITARVGD